MYPLWLLLAVFIAAAIVGRVLLARRRQIRELHALAKKRRLNFSSVDLIGLHERYYNLELIRRGHARHAWNVLYGSTDAGLVALFRYSYDLGFRVNQTVRQWWIAVVETPDVHDHWSARPAPGTEPDPADADANAMPTARIAGLVVTADHASMLNELARPTLRNLFEQADPGYHWEARGSLLAVAMPADDHPDTPDHLLTTACDLAQKLKLGAGAPPGGAVADAAAG